MHLEGWLENITLIDLMSLTQIQNLRKHKKHTLFSVIHKKDLNTIDTDMMGHKDLEDSVEADSTST